VGGYSEDNSIALLWQDHLNNLYNSVQDKGAKDHFFTRIKSSAGTLQTCLLSIHEISDAITIQKMGKADGPDAYLWKLFLR